jgi:hypothetical protein
LSKSLLLILTFFLTISCADKSAIEEIRVNPQKIVGGELVDKKEFHSVVAIVRGGDIICSGVVIDKQMVMTAAHCLAGQNRNSLSVLTGKGTRLPRHNRRVKGQYFVDRVEIFPSLRITPHLGITNLGEFDANDIGILHVNRVFRNIKPYKILTDVNLIKEKMVAGEMLTIVGYGYTGEDQSFGLTESHVEYGLKRKVEVPIVGYSNHEVDARADGKDSCYVDSGAPALVKTDEGYQILGVVSGSDGMCGENEFPAYYSLLFDSACWISEVTGLEFTDLDFHCERRETIVEACSSVQGKKAARKCATEKSDEIFSQFE